ncbi:hypothetical protein LXL04_034797 [Taraxacum kok-saghyz]
MDNQMLNKEYEKAEDAKPTTVPPGKTILFNHNQQAASTKEGCNGKKRSSKIATKTQHKAMKPPKKRGKMVKKTQQPQKLKQRWFTTLKSTVYLTPLPNQHQNSTSTTKTITGQQQTGSTNTKEKNNPAAATLAEKTKMTKMPLPPNNTKRSLKTNCTKLKTAEEPPRPQETSKPKAQDQKESGAQNQGTKKKPKTGTKLKHKQPSHKIAPHQPTKNKPAKRDTQNKNTHQSPKNQPLSQQPHEENPKINLDAANQA